MEQYTKFTIGVGVNGQESVDRLNASLKAMGAHGQVSARQTAAAMRMLPAQFTDIVTQLAGGQNPFLILIQQGGQIKDMFGGIGPAVRAVASALTPARVAFGGLAAAAGALAVAYAQGQGEADAFNRSVALTGNAAGQTAQSVRNMADALRASSGVSAGVARDLVAGAVSSGAFGPGSFDAAVSAMARLQKLSGRAADDILKEFSRMSSGVARWAAEANRSYNFLTVEQYKYIRALEQQGKVEEAQRVAASALDKALAERNVQLGWIERSWNAVKAAASGAWDAMLNVGRPDTLQDQLQRMQNTLALRKQQGPLAGGANPQINASWEKGNAELERQIALLQERIILERKQAESMSRNAAANRAGIAEIESGEAKRVADAQVSLAMARLQNASRARVAALELEQQKVENLRSAGLLSEQAAADQVLALRRRVLGEEVALIEAEIAAERRRATEGAGEAAQKEVRLAQLAGKLSAARAKIPQAEAEAAGATNARLVADAREQAQAWSDVWKRAKDAVQSLADRNASARIGLMSDPVARANAEIDQEIEKVRRDVKDLERDLNLRIELSSDPGQIQALRDQLAALRDEADISVRLANARRPGQRDAFDGMRSGLAEVGAQAMDTASRVQEVFTNAFNGAADSLTNFLLTGKGGFREFARSVIADIVRMIVKQQLFNALSGAFGAFGGGGGSLPVGNVGGTPQAGFAKGGAFDAGGVQAFARGGVVDSPTLFRFASGGAFKTGLMGEAGPEAIMPLRRGPDGKLGVVATGGGGSGGVTIGSIVVNSDGAAANDPTGRNAAELGRAISQAVQAEILKQQRPGGLLSPV